MVDEFQNIVSKINFPLTQDDRKFLISSYEFSRRAHDGQKRYSGEAYFKHTLRVAYNLAEIGGDIDTIAAGFLHDTIEDCGVSKDEIEQKFGSDVSFLVDGVSKLGGIKYGGRQRYAENMRHLFISLSQDIRVILIKLSDRLDNIRTLEYVPKEKRTRIAIETLEIYTPIANRLGMGKLKSELENISFKYAFPEKHIKVAKLIKEKGKERERYLNKVYKSLVKQLAKNGITDVNVSYRIKDLYSIYNKLLKKDMDVAKVYDIYALRVIVPTVGDCYRSLGIIHDMWRPLPGRIKDYISVPKVNGYQSLHTTVFIGDGGIAEIQIRTSQMHKESEYGIASHLMYKEKGVSKKNQPTKEYSMWLTQIKDLKDSSESEEFWKYLKLDLFEKRIFVFTPKGDVVELPEDASPLDFAYYIHTEIGDHTGGAKVNGKFVSLDAKLKNGDIVEIQTKNSNHPTRKWLTYARTNLAKRSIKNYLSKESLN